MTPITSRTFLLFVAIAGSGLTGCSDAPQPSVEVTNAATSPARAEPDYLWASVETINHDEASGIAPCVHVAQDDADDLEERSAHLTVTYLKKGTEQVMHESFDVPIGEATLVFEEDEVAIELPALALAANAEADSIEVTAEIVQTPSTLPDFWLADIQQVETNEAWGINPCVHVARAAHFTAASHEITLAVTASYQDGDGEAIEDTFLVPLSSTTIMNEAGPILGVEPVSPLPLSSEPESALTIETSLAWH
jgi:hypothetical protein